MARYLWEKPNFKLDGPVEPEPTDLPDQEERVSLISEGYEKQFYSLRLLQRKDFLDRKLPEEVIKLPWIIAPDNSNAAEHSLEVCVFNPIPRKRIDSVVWCGECFTRDSARYLGMVDATLELRYHDGLDGGRTAFAYFYQGQFKEGDSVMIREPPRGSSLDEVISSSINPTYPPELDEDLIERLEGLRKGTSRIVLDYLKQEQAFHSKPYRYELKTFRGDLTRYFRQICGGNLQDLPAFGFYIKNIINNSNLPEDVKEKFREL